MNSPARTNYIGGFNSWWSQLVTNIMIGDNVISSKNQLHSFISSMILDSKTPFDISIPEFISGQAVDLAKLICGSNCSKSQENLMVIRELARLLPMLKKYECTPQTINEYLTFFSPTNKIFQNIGKSKNKFEAWDSCISMVITGQSAFMQLMDTVAPILQSLSIKSLNTLMGTFDLIGPKHSDAKTDIPKEILIPLLEVICGHLKDKSSEYYRPENADVFKLVLEFSKRMISYNFEFGQPYLQVLKDTTSTCIESSSFESNKLGLILLSFLYENKLVDEIFNANDIIDKFLEKDLNNALIEEFSSLFFTLAKRNYINFEHLNQVWEKCQRVHTSQKDAYLMIICNSLAELDINHGYDFVESIVDNNPNEPLAYKILIHMLKIKEFSPLHNNIIDKIVNADINGKSPVLAVIKDLSGTDNTDVSRNIIRAAIKKFRTDPTSYLALLLCMAVRSADSIDVYREVKLKDITDALKSHRYASDVGNQLLFSFLRKCRGKCMLDKNEVRKIMTFPDKSIFRLLCLLVDENPTMYFTDDGIQELHFYCISHPQPDEDFIVFMIKIAQEHWHRTKEISYKFFPKTNEEKYIVKTRDLVFEQTLKNIVFDNNQPNDFVPSYAMNCLIGLWDGMTKGDYKSAVLELFDEIYTEIDQRSQNIKLLKAIFEKRCMNKTFEELGYIRHKDNVISSPRMVRISLKNKEFTVLVHRDDTISTLITKISVLKRHFTNVTLEHNRSKLDPQRKLKELKAFNKVIVANGNHVVNPKINHLNTPPYILSKAGVHGKILDLIEGGLVTDEDQKILTKLLNAMPDDPEVIALMKSMKDFVESLNNVSIFRLQYMLECFLTRSFDRSDITSFVKNDGIRILTGRFQSTDNPIQLRTVLNILRNCQMAPDYKEHQDEIIPFIISKLGINGCMQPIVDLIIPFGKDALYYIEINMYDLEDVIENMRPKSLPNFMKIFTEFCPNLFELCKAKINHSNFAMIFVSHCQKQKGNELSNAQFCLESIKLYPEVSNILASAMEPLFEKISPADTVPIVSELLEVAKQPEYATARSAIYKAITNINSNANSIIISNYIHELSSKIRIDNFNYNPSSMIRNELGVGLKNLGSTCYINSVIQMLRSLKPFVSELMKADSNDAMIRQLQLLVANLELSQQKYINPASFVSSFRQFGDIPIDVKEQQDAIEFYSMLMDQLPQSIQDLFNGNTLTTICGLENEFENQTTEKSLLFDLEVTSCSKISDSFQLMLEHEHFEGENGYKVEELGKKVDYERFSQITRTPEILCLHLKRFEYDSAKGTRVKVNSKLEFPIDEMTISKYVMKGTPNTHYKFHGAIIHCGNAMRGHYYTIIKKNENEYLKFEDSEVSLMSKEAFIKTAIGGIRNDVPESAYILFYTRNEENEFQSFKEICPKEIKETIERKDSEFDKCRNAFEPQLCTLAKKNCLLVHYMEYILRVFVHSTMKNEASEIDLGFVNRIRTTEDLQLATQFYIDNSDEILDIIMRSENCKDFAFILCNIVLRIVTICPSEDLQNIVITITQKLLDNFSNTFNVENLSQLLKDCFNEREDLFSQKGNTIVNMLCDTILNMFNERSKPIYLQTINATNIFEIIRKYASKHYIESMSQLNYAKSYVMSNRQNLASYQNMISEIKKAMDGSTMNKATDVSVSEEEISLIIKRLSENSFGSLLNIFNQKLLEGDAVIYQRIIDNAENLLLNPLRKKDSMIAFHLITTALPSSKVLRDSPAPIPGYKEIELVRELTSAFAKFLNNASDEEIPTNPEFFKVLKAMIVDYGSISTPIVPLKIILKLISAEGKLSENRVLIDLLMDCIPSYKSDITIDDVIGAIDQINRSLTPIRTYGMILFNSASQEIQREAIHLQKFKGYIQEYLRVINSYLESVGVFVDSLLRLYEQNETDAGECLHIFLDHRYNNYSNIQFIYKAYLKLIPIYPDLTKYYDIIFQKILFRKEEEPVRDMIDAYFENEELIPPLNEGNLQYMFCDKWTDDTFLKVKKLILRDMKKNKKLKQKALNECKKCSRLASIGPLYYIEKDKKEKFMESVKEVINQKDLYNSLSDKNLPQINKSWMKKMTTEYMPQITLCSTHCVNFYRYAISTFDKDEKESLVKKCIQVITQKHGKLPNANRRFIKSLNVLKESEINTVEKNVITVVCSSDSDVVVIN